MSPSVNQSITARLERLPPTRGFWRRVTLLSLGGFFEFYDMFLTATPVGLSALTYCLIGAATGALRISVLQERRSLLPLTALVGTAAGVLLFVGAGDVLGQTQLLGAGRAWLIRVMIVESLWNAVLALPVGYIYAWVARGSAGADRVGSPVPRPTAPIVK